MIGFIQYLVEGRDATLFHGTSLENLKAILKTDKLVGKLDTKPTSNYVNQNVIYLSRNYRHAGFMADVKAYETNSEDVIIEISQRLMSNRFKIRPNHSSKKAKFKSPEFGGNDESEEVVVAKEIKGFIKYIVAIHVNNRVVKDKEINWLLTTLNIPVFIYTSVRDKSTKVGEL